MNPERDTDWKLSTKGNWWRRMNGKVLVVGQGREGGYWVMVDGHFLEEHFPYLEPAQSAAERRGS